METVEHNSGVEMARGLTRRKVMRLLLRLGVFLGEGGKGLYGDVAHHHSDNSAFGLRGRRPQARRMGRTTRGRFRAGRAIGGGDNHHPVDLPAACPAIKKRAERKRRTIRANTLATPRLVGLMTKDYARCIAGAPSLPIHP